MTETTPPTLPGPTPEVLAAPDRCPRCGGGFHCGVDGAGPCACTRITLDADTLARLRREFDGCLCLDCLAELAATGRSGPAAALTGQPPETGPW